MQYKVIIEENNRIEFHNSWAGEETVYLNGQLVSKKSSFWGTSHYFEAFESGEKVRYILTSKVASGMEVQLDLVRNGELVQKNIPVNFGNLPEKPESIHKEQGKKHLKNYDLDDALQAFEKAKSFNEKDPEVYFLMACVFSLKEDVQRGFECIKLSVDKNLINTEDISTHDFLAYLRIQPEFEDFRSNGYRTYTLDRSAEEK